MKDLTEDQITEKAKDAICAPLLIDVGDNSWTDWDQEITWDGRTYIPQSVSISGFGMSGNMPLDGGSIVVGNADLALSTIILSGGIKDAAVSIREALHDEDYAVIGTEMIFEGEVNGQAIDYDSDKATIGAGLRKTWIGSTPHRGLSRTCEWLFKDSDCGYAGAETSCIKTWERCGELSNQARFSGSPHTLIAGTIINLGSVILEVE